MEDKIVVLKFSGREENWLQFKREFIAAMIIKLIDEFTSKVAFIDLPTKGTKENRKFTAYIQQCLKFILAAEVNTTHEFNGKEC